MASILMAAAIPTLADIAPVISWQVDTSNQKAFPLAIRRGETVILEARHDLDFTGATNAMLEYRPIGSTARPYVATGTLYNATSGVVRVRWDSSTEGTNSAYQYEIVVRSSNAVVRRAFGTLTVLDSMAGDGILPTPPSGTGDTLAPSSPDGVYPNDIAPIKAWTVTPDEQNSYAIPLIQGETVILQPTFDGLDLSGAAAVALRYRPIGASGWHYVAPGTIHNATGGVVRVRWNSAIEGTNTAYQYEIAVQSQDAMLLRSFGTITVRPSLSGSSTSMPTRVTTFDWATVDHVNIGSAPFLSEVALAPFSSFWASLTNGTADINVRSILVDGQPIGSGGGGIGSYTNTEIAGVSHTNSVRIGDGSNLTWRLRGGVWCPDVEAIAGIQGPPGTNGVDGAVGPQGPPGTNGVDGAVGPQGPQGPPGTNGVDGAQGPQGPAGTNGVDGATGPQGPQGPQGVPGTNGTDGAVGPQGLPGTNGVDGAQGPQGPQGIQGPPGTNGADGAVGPQGPQGPTGSVSSLVFTNSDIGASTLLDGVLKIGTNVTPAAIVAAGGITNVSINGTLFNVVSGVATGAVAAGSGGGRYATNSVTPLEPVGNTGTVTAAADYWQWSLTNNSTLTATMTDFPTNLTSALGLSIYYGAYALTPITGEVFSASSVALLGTPSTNSWNLYSITKGYGATNLTIQGPIQ